MKMPSKVEYEYKCHGYKQEAHFLSSLAQWCNLCVCTCAALLEHRSDIHSD